MKLRQSPSGPFVGFLLVALDRATKDNATDTFTAGAAAAPVTTTGGTLIVSYVAKPNHVYQERCEAIINAANVAAAGTDTFQGALERRTTVGGVAGAWVPVAPQQVRETETANATQAMPLVQSTPDDFTPTEETLVEFRLVVNAVTSNATVLQGNAQLSLEVYE